MAETGMVAMRFALGLEYDGTGFCGWQRQPRAPSLQAELERALSAVAGVPLTVVAAGRTDRGVHASAQVVHFDTSVQRSETAWVRGTNAHLPTGMAVLWARSVSEQFHARFCACARSYEYLLLSHPVRPGLMRNKWAWTHQPLALERMTMALPALLGTHDFSAFRAAECQARSPVKTLTHTMVQARNGLFRFGFTADAFLQHMVRNLVGALVEVGSGAASPTWLAELLAGGDRSRGARTFPPEGLYLTGVHYPEQWGIPTAFARIQEGADTR